MNKSESINDIGTALSLAQRSESRLVPMLANHIRPFKRVNGTSATKMPMRFFEKICFGLSDCWYWRGCIDDLGYGRFNFKNENKAHRASWNLFNGDIPSGLSVLHICDIRNCVNPTHLYLGTQQDNMRDCASKGRIVAKPAFGSDNPMAVLDEQKVLRIRAEFATGLTRKALASKFGVSTSTISRVVTKKLWKKV